MKAVTDLKRKRSNEVNEMEAKLKRSTKQTSPAQQMARILSTGIVHDPASTLKPTFAARIEGNANTSGTATGYVYEIDCKKVRDHVSVTDLVRIAFCNLN